MDTRNGDLAGNAADDAAEPVMDMDVVDRGTQLHGVIVQTIADLGEQYSRADLTRVVHERTQDADLGYSLNEVATQLHSVLGEASVAPSVEGA